MFGQLHYLITDVHTARPEMKVNSYGFRIDAHGVLETDAPLLADLRTPGLKRVTVIDRPRGVVYASADVLVVPFEAAPKG